MVGMKLIASKNKSYFHYTSKSCCYATVARSNQATSVLRAWNRRKRY